MLHAKLPPLTLSLLTVAGGRDLLGLGQLEAVGVTPAREMTQNAGQVLNVFSFFTVFALKAHQRIFGPLVLKGRLGHPYTAQKALAETACDCLLL
jgi:hypothetical protein